MTVGTIPLFEIVFTRCAIILILSFVWMKKIGQPVFGPTHIRKLLVARALTGFISMLSFIYRSVKVSKLLMVLFIYFWVNADDVTELSSFKIVLSFPLCPFDGQFYLIFQLIYSSRGLLNTHVFHFSNAATWPTPKNVACVLFPSMAMHAS